MTSNESYSLDDIMNLIEADSRVQSAKLYISPPTNNNDSDEDSGEEDDADINHLTRHQLLANTEASVKIFKNGEVITEIISSDISQQDSTVEQNAPSVQITPTILVNNCSSDKNLLPTTSPNALSNETISPSTEPSKRKNRSVKKNVCNQTIPPTVEPPPPKKKRPDERTWETKDIQPIPEKEWSVPDWLVNYEKTPADLFELFYDDDIIKLICDYTNQYATEKGQPSGYTVADIRCFIGILLVTGYNQVPRVKMYWEAKDDVWNKGIAEAMPRNKFLNIMRCLHVCNNNELEKDTKFAKVSPLWRLLNERWLKFFAGDVNLSVDESMIPYFGRHSAKQHLHGKPIRFGYKAWCICTRFGYLVQADLYEGARTGNTDPEVGVGGSTVLNLCKNLPQRNDGYNLFFDNFFSSVVLLEKLKENGHTGTGTIRPNRVDKAPLIDVKKIQNMPRGSFDQLTEKDSNITLVRYNDNNVVTVISTAFGANPVAKVQRYSAAEKKRVSVNQPLCVAFYNQYMGGVDRLDENISKLRIGVRGKKWYWQLLMFPINVSVNNAWILYRWSNQSKTNRMDLLSFTREITLTYLKKYSSRVSIGRPIQVVPLAVDKRVTSAVRFDNEGHLISKGEKQTRCGQCKKNTTMKCMKCNVALHTKCFVDFHSKKE